MMGFLRKYQWLVGVLWLAMGVTELFLAVVNFRRGGAGDPGFYVDLPVGLGLFLVAWLTFRRARRVSRLTD
ncbi:hypothetical protein [Cryptosporangium phraense]|uniref:Uncharacterized protein n=1 Tax=Cryptosporangium phraense TaxID=2593070 RepID=A0A545AX28_9ACTN|nr:hypothetical protein [Cryptosporangium phraense]TQS45155.1 hypothetical protein FL583_11725 [Cryptosporangium phraense]